MASDYVDLDGNEITRDQWTQLSHGNGLAMGQILAEKTMPTPHGEVQVRTVWNGLRLPALGIKPFGTARSAGGDVWTELEQYDTKQEALLGHCIWLVSVAVGLDFD